MVWVGTAGWNVKMFQSNTLVSPSPLPITYFSPQSKVSTTQTSELTRQPSLDPRHPNSYHPLVRSRNPWKVWEDQIHKRKRFGRCTPGGFFAKLRLILSPRDPGSPNVRWWARDVHAGCVVTGAINVIRFGCHFSLWRDPGSYDHVMFPTWKVQ